MIIGSIHIDAENGSVSTHRDSYLLDSLTVVSVRRPFFIGGLLCGTGLTGFVAAFGDLLYAHEIALTVVIAVVSILSAYQVGQLKLLSRDLRGSELSDAVWGRYASLNAVRLRIARAISARRAGGRS